MTDRDPIIPGNRFALYLSVKIQEGWHIYSLEPLHGNELLATKIILEENFLEKGGNWKESSISFIQDGAQEKLVKAHINIAEFHQEFSVPKNFAPGPYSLSGKFLYRACDNKLCTLPQTLPFITRFQVGFLE